MKILLAVDESEFADTAVRAIQRFPSDQVEVLILHVVAPIDFYVAPISYVAHPRDVDVVRNQVQERAHQIIGRAEKLLRDAGYRVQTTIETGDARTVILDVAADRHCDLIVVGSHGRSGLDRILMGSVAEYVARHAKCSVQIARAPGLPAQPEKKIVRKESTAALA